VPVTARPYLVNGISVHRNDCTPLCPKWGIVSEGSKSAKFPPDAQLPAILSLAKAYGVTALDKVSGAGTMSLDLRASGPVRSLSKADIIKALNGSININFNNVKYSGANLNQQLASIAGSSSLALIIGRSDVSVQICHVSKFCRRNRL